MREKVAQYIKEKKIIVSNKDLSHYYRKNPDDFKGEERLKCIENTKGRIEMIQFLIDNNADINAQDAYGDTPLHKACAKKSVEPVETLLAAGADMTVLNKKKETPLQVAVRLKNTFIVEFLTGPGTQ